MLATRVPTATRVYLLSLSPATIVSVQFATATDEMAESRGESYRADAGDFGSRARTPRVEDAIDEWRVPLTARLGRQPKKDGEIGTSDDIHAHSVPFKVWVEGSSGALFTRSFTAFNVVARQ